MSAVGIPLSEIVEDYMTEEERTSMHKYPVYLHHAINGYRDLWYNVSGVLKQVEIDVNLTNNTINLPSDIINIARVAFFDGYGSLISLEENKNIFRGNDDCGNPSTINRNNPIGSFSYADTSNTFGDHYRSGQSIGNWFGIGGHQPAGYRYNAEYNILELNTGFNCVSIILEYLSDIEKIGDDFKVHPFLREAIKDYIDWSRVKRKDSYSNSDKQARHTRYTMSKLKAKMMISGKSYSEWRNTDRKTFYLGVKF